MTGFVFLLMPQNRYVGINGEIDSLAVFVLFALGCFFGLGLAAFAG
jgi:hypothetical protein